MGWGNCRRDEPFKPTLSQKMEIRAIKRGENGQNLSPSLSLSLSRSLSLSLFLSLALSLSLSRSLALSLSLSLSLVSIHVYMIVDLKLHVEIVHNKGRQSSSMRPCESLVFEFAKAFFF